MATVSGVSSSDKDTTGLGFAGGFGDPGISAGLNTALVQAKEALGAQQAVQGEAAREGLVADAVGAAGNAMTGVRDIDSVNNMDAASMSTKGLADAVEAYGSQYGHQGLFSNLADAFMGKTYRDYTSDEEALTGALEKGLVEVDEQGNRSLTTKGTLALMSMPVSMLAQPIGAAVAGPVGGLLGGLAGSAVGSLSGNASMPTSGLATGLLGSLGMPSLSTAAGAYGKLASAANYADTAGKLASLTGLGTTTTTEEQPGSSIAGGEGLLAQAERDWRNG